MYLLRLGSCRIEDVPDITTAVGVASPTLSVLPFLLFRTYCRSQSVHSFPDYCGMLGKGRCLKINLCILLIPMALFEWVSCGGKGGGEPVRDRKNQ